MSDSAKWEKYEHLYSEIEDEILRADIRKTTDNIMDNHPFYWDHPESYGIIFNLIKRTVIGGEKAGISSINKVSRLVSESSRSARMDDQQTKKAKSLVEDILK